MLNPRSGRVLGKLLQVAVFGITATAIVGMGIVLLSIFILNVAYLAIGPLLILFGFIMESQIGYLLMGCGFVITVLTLVQANALEE